MAFGNNFAKEIIESLINNEVRSLFGNFSLKFKAFEVDMVAVLFDLNAESNEIKRIKEN